MTEEEWKNYREFAGKVIESTDAEGRMFLVCYCAAHAPDVFTEAMTALALEKIEQL